MDQAYLLTTNHGTVYTAVLALLALHRVSYSCIVVTVPLCGRVVGWSKGGTLDTHNTAVILIIIMGRSVFDLSLVVASSWIVPSAPEAERFGFRMAGRV